MVRYYSLRASICTSVLSDCLVHTTVAEDLVHPQDRKIGIVSVRVNVHVTVLEVEDCDIE